MSNINKKYKFNGEVRDKDATYVGKDKHGESWYKLDFNKMTGSPILDWERQYPMEMAQARKKFLCTKSGKVGSIKPSTSSCATETITTGNGDSLLIKILEAKTVQLFKTRKNGSKKSTPHVVNRARVILSTFVEPAQEDIRGEDVHLHHDLDDGVTKEELTVEQQADISIVSWIEPGAHRLISNQQTKNRFKKKGDMEEDIKNLSGNRNVMNDGLLKLIKDIEESNTEGSYMCATIKTKYDLAEHVRNHLENLIEINN